MKRMMLMLLMSGCGEPVYEAVKCTGVEVHCLGDCVLSCRWIGKGTTVETVRREDSCTAWCWTGEGTR